MTDDDERARRLLERAGLLDEPQTPEARERATQGYEAALATLMMGGDRARLVFGVAVPDIFRRTLDAIARSPLADAMASDDDDTVKEAMRESTRLLAIAILSTIYANGFVVGGPREMPDAPGQEGG
jgi:hypothetical protein